jgi:hypothetical protein
MTVFSDKVTTTTNVKIMPKIVDTVLGSNVFAARMLANAKKWSGDQMKFPVKYQNGVSGGSFTGYDTFSTAASTRRVNLAFDPKFYQKTITLPLTEVDVNNTDSKVMDLLGTECALAAQEMADEIGTLMYADGTGNSSKDFLGLEAIVDDATNAATYGSLARATYTTLKSTVTASSGTLTLAKMATLFNAVAAGSQKPTLGLTTETVWSLYESLLQPMERINMVSTLSRGKGVEGSAGFTALQFKGMPIIADEKCTSGVLYFLNEDFLNFYALPSKMNQPIQYNAQEVEGNDYGSSVKGLGFSFTGWVKPTNSYSVIGHVILGGQLISENPKRHGKLTGITGI